MSTYSIRSKDTNVHYQKGCPLLLSASSILLDQQNNIVVGQFKFQNISPLQKQICNTTISISCFNANNAPCGNVEKFTYFNLAADLNDFFGQQLPVALPSLDTQRIEISVISVLFSDNTCWDRNGYTSMIPVPSQPEISSLGELAAQYRRELELSNEQENLFVETPDYWLCCCGEYNDYTAENCRLCNRNRETQKKAIQVNYLKERKIEFDKRQTEEQKYLELEKLAQEQETLEDKKYFRKIGLIFLAAVVCVVSGLALLRYTGPQRNYKSGLSLYESGNYTAAYNAFEAAGEDFKDAKEKLKQCRYGQAIGLYEQKEYQKAIEIFSDIGKDYLDTNDYFEKCYYQEAIKNYTSGNYVLAYEQFSLISEQTDDIKNYIQQCIEKGYEKAINEYSESGTIPESFRSPMFDNYMDTDKYRIILDSQLLVLYKSSDEQFRASYEAMRELGDFGNASELIKNQKYIFWLLDGHSFSNQLGYSFTLEDDHAKYGLPENSIYHYDDVEHFEFLENIYVVYRADGSNRYYFRFDFSDEKTLNLYCFRDGSTYTLYRQY